MKKYSTPIVSLFSWISIFCLPVSLLAQDYFSDLVGSVQVQSVAKGGAVEVPYILWGGDVATFLANGDLKTKPSSIFQQSGLDIQLVPGDDFVGQVKNYMQGKSPFLRGTMHMICLLYTSPSPRDRQKSRMPSSA